MSILFGCLAALLAQATFLHRLRFRDGVISAVMIPLVLGTHARPAREAASIAAAAGFAEDVLCGSGCAWTLATVTVILLVNRLAQMIALERVPFAVVAVASATLLRDLLFWSIERVGNAPTVVFVHDVHVSLWSAALTGLAATAFVRPLRRFAQPMQR